MYKTFDSHWDSDCEEDNDSSASSSFWSDHEGEAEEREYYVVKESDEEVRECFVLEGEADGTRQDKPGQLGENTREGEHSDQSRGWDNTENEKHAVEGRGDEAKAKSDWEKQLETEEDQSKCTGGVEEDYEEDWSCNSETEQQEAVPHHQNTEQPEAVFHHQNTEQQEAVPHHQNTEQPEAVPHHQNTEPQEAVSHHQNTEPQEAVPHHQNTEQQEAVSHHQNTEQQEAVSHHQNTEHQKAVSHHQNTEQHEAVSHHQNTEMAAGEATDEEGDSEEEAENRSAQAKEHWDENEDMGNDLEDRREKEGELDYPMSPTSVMTSGYGTYRPDSSRDNHEGDGYHDDCTLTEPEDDSEAQFDAQYYVDNYNLSMKGNTFSSDVMLCDGQLRNKPNSPDLPEHCSNHTDSDHEGRGLYVVDEGLVLECNVDDSVQGDEAVEGESQHRDNEVFDPNEQRSRESHSASGVQKVTVRNENDFSSLCDSYEHPFNLRSNKWKYFQRRRLEAPKFDRKTRRQKKSGVSGLEECLDRLQMSGMRRPQESELESQELDSLSSAGELPSAFQAYFKGIVRSRSENDIRPRPKSFIRPLMDHPHTRNLKKTDPVTKYFQYKQEWDTFKAPGERDRRALHWAIREQLMYQPPPPRPQKVLVPNTYVVPTDKKRSALRWEIRHDLANGIMPSKMAYP